MTKFNVHVFAIVRVEVPGIEADTHEQAIDKATEKLSPVLSGHNFSDIGYDAEYTGDDESYMVDVAGDDEYEQSRLFTYGKRGPLEEATLIIQGTVA